MSELQAKIAQNKIKNKAFQAEVDALYREVASGVQFDIFDLTHVLNSANAEILSGDFEAAKIKMSEAVQKYRKN